MKQKVGIVGGNIGYHKMFLGNHWNTMDIISVGNVTTALDLILFTGGTDVNPLLYGEVRNNKTNNPDVPRDSRETQIFSRAVQLNIPMVGICRGSQFLCVMNKGRLVQHVTNHAIGRTHEILTADGDIMDVTSTHHQMMQPKDNGQVLAWAEGLSDVYEGDGGKPIQLDVVGMEPEVVVWEKTKSVGFQYHPEYMMLNAPAVKYFFEIVEDLVNEAA